MSIMSYNQNLNNVKMVDRTLVEKILEQGQKLRNAMVESILRNDPFFNMEVIYNKHFNTPEISASNLVENNLPMEDNILSPSVSNKRLDAFAFLNGDYLTKDEECLALQTVRSMSVSDLCKTSHKANKGLCKCATCMAYNVDNLKCDLRRTVGAANVGDLTAHIQNKYKSEFLHFFKHTDCMKVTIYSIHLTEAGIQKVFYCDKSRKSPKSISPNYFVEYKIPDLIRKVIRNNSKVDSGLENKHIRVCARGSNKVISVKQTFVHDVANLDKICLEDCELKFKISYRNHKQKTADILGHTKFCFKEFEVSKNLTCIKGLAIHLMENCPIIVGILKCSFQLGCGKCYFGKEFIDAVVSNNENSVVLDIDDIGSDQLSVEEQPFLFKSSLFDAPVEDTVNKKEPSPSNINVVKNCKSNKVVNRVDVNKNIANKKTEIDEPVREKSTQIIESVPFKENIPLRNLAVKQTKITEKQVLVGFVYISEAQYFTGSKTTYFTCRPFLQDETSTSRLVVNSFNPIFMFFQSIPLLYEEDLLTHLRENCIIIEFWEKTDSADVVFGLSKIDLHQFYLAHRNPVISKHLSNKKLPVIGSDWWEPIYNLSDEELVGQVQVLTALGTEEQIQQLKLERGFKENVVRAKFSTLQKENKPLERVTFSSNLNDKSKTKIHDGVVKNNKSKDLKTSKEGCSERRQKGLNTGVQTDPEVKMEPNKEEPKKVSPTQEMIGSLLDQILSFKHRNVYVENGTNTDENNASNKEITIAQNVQGSTTGESRKTSDLLESLQTALAVETNQPKKVVNATFKALISINNANQLPSKKKFKSKKMRGKSAKHEDYILPSTYVTFETLPNSNLNITPVVPKSTAPRWDYKCEVKLPVDLLTNCQKRLILKVWKKSTNTVMQPNLQTDTVLGFAAVDLTVLLAGLPNVQGWFNIIDFSGKCNGQINVHVTPLENLSQWHKQMLRETSAVPDQIASSLEMSSEPLSRALKRKFTELDEITQRLRLRLSEVTTEDSESSNDDIAEEFERDISSLCVEDDFDLINFEEARKFSENHNRNVTLKNDAHLISVASGNTNSQSFVEHMECVENGKLETEKEESSSTSILELQKELFLDQHLLQEKQRIDTLLKKLTLISSDTNNIFSNRYVSGCSVTTENVDTEALLNDLDHESRPNIRGMTNFNPVSFQQLYGGYMYSPLSSNSNNDDLSTPKTSGSSEASIKTNLSNCRPTPDGEGSTEDRK